MSKYKESISSIMSTKEEVKMLVFGLTVIAGGLSVLEVVMTIIDEKERKKHAIIFTIEFLLSLVGAFILVFTYDIPSPAIERKNDYSAIELSCDKGFSIEYRLSAGSDDKWIKYSKPIKIEKNTILYARTVFLFLKSEEESKDIFVAENGLIYFGGADTPGDSIVRINAQYNYENMVPNEKAGNYYAGYEMKRDDIGVKGITLNGEEKEIYDFKYSPNVLKEGKNDILVEYYFSKNTSVKTHIYINAKEPEMYKISAVYIGNNNNIGADLSSEDFKVMATYEDSSRNDINEFTISYEKLGVGKNEITIVKSNLLCVVTINCVDLSKIERNEVEDNNSFATANHIKTNVQYVGRISDENDVDYYKFNVQSDSKVRIEFSHQKIDEEDVYWEVSLFAINEEDKLNFQSIGTASEKKSSIIRLQTGVYYVKVAPYYYSGERYKIKVELEQVSDAHEIEPNDEMENESTKIRTNKDYVGNLYKEDDIDCYEFEILNKGKVTIYFEHKKNDENNAIWRINLYGASEEEIYSSEVNGINSKFKTDSVRLPKGKYYIRISSYYWNDMDYKIKVKYNKEGAKFETESNDDYSLANPIRMNKKIVGNMQSSEDVDFYKIKINKKIKKLKIIFTHNQIDDSNIYWEIELHSEKSDDALENNGGITQYNICGSAARFSSSIWKNIKPGNYYIKVRCSYYDNSDYILQVKS